MKVEILQRNIHSKPFDQGTKQKLEIFSECFKAWLPVFLHDRYTRSIHVFDLFAGSGSDSEGYPGSPLKLLFEARGRDRKNCISTAKPIAFTFCEFLKKKHQELKGNIDSYISRCKTDNNCSECVFKYEVLQDEFINVFNKPAIISILEDRGIGKFILLDQNGFKEIDESVFQRLISYPKTDFIFFISSSFIKRFKEHPNILAHIQSNQIDFSGKKPGECHRVIADFFRNQIPDNSAYYLHHFTIKKQSNYYGLIFGTSHSYGMEKFLKVCWEKDTFSGEANFNIDNNYPRDSLFFEEGKSYKLDIVKDKIKSDILSGKIRDNSTGLIAALKAGCLPRVFTEVVKDMEQQGLILRTGKVNNSSTRIHKVINYSIEVLACD